MVTFFLAEKGYKDPNDYKLGINHIVPIWIKYANDILVEYISNFRRLRRWAQLVGTNGKRALFGNIAVPGIVATLHLVGEKKDFGDQEYHMDHGWIT